ALLPITSAISPSKSTRPASGGIAIDSPDAITAEGGLKKSIGWLGSSLPSSRAWAAEFRPTQTIFPGGGRVIDASRESRPQDNGGRRGRPLPPRWGECP